MKRVLVCSPFDAARLPRDFAGLVVSTTSHDPEKGRLVSPFLLGPVALYEGHCAKNMENAWQYAKVYLQHTEADGSAGTRYWDWAQAGWAKARADRYPMGKGARPLHLLWQGERLGYIAARKRVYFPLYRDAVIASGGFARMRELQAGEGTLMLVDFDGYLHESLGMNLAQVLNHPTRKMGHAFVLAAMLQYGPDITPEALEGLEREPAQANQLSLI